MPNFCICTSGLCKSYNELSQNESCDSTIIDNSILVFTLPPGYNSLRSIELKRKHLNVMMMNLKLNGEFNYS